jgi:DNA-binding NtrC family response regulator
MSLGNVLVIDDEKNIRRLILNEFTIEGYSVSTAKDGEEGLAKVRRKPYDVVVLDIKLPKLDGMEVLKKIKEISKSIEVIMITGYGDIKSAVASLKLGARDYVTKPFKLDDLLAIVQEAISECREKKSPKPVAFDGERPSKAKSFIACPSPAMQAVYRLVQRVAKTDHTILLHGETGVGKDVLASQIHQQSLRQSGPFVVVDCGLLSHNLAESELYGHRKGAFSGATETKVGLVEKSHTGTLFLDEIGNIDLQLQKKFLRFLETRRFRRVGQTKEQHIDSRIILATNLDTEKAILDGTLRSDLFYRITEFTIVIPPLRDRIEDVPALAKYFIGNLPHGDTRRGISKEAETILSSYPWPGNIRELKAVIGKCALLSDSDEIQPDDLPANMKARHYDSPQKSLSLEDMEKEHIINVLAETEGNQTRAAQILGINRKTLYKKIHRYKIFS